MRLYLRQLLLDFFTPGSFHEFVFLVKYFDFDEGELLLCDCKLAVQVFW